MSRAAYLLGFLLVWSGAVRARDLIGEAQARHEAEVAGLEVPRPLSLVRLEAAVRACSPGRFFGEPRHLHPEAPLTDQVRVRRILAGCREVLEAVYASPDEDMGELLGHHELPTGLHLAQLVELDRVRAQLDGEDPAGQLRRALRLLALSSRQDDKGWSNSGWSTHQTLQLLWPLFSDLSPEHAWRAWLQVEALVVAAVPGEEGPVDDACLLRPPVPHPPDLTNRMAWACRSASWGTHLEERRLMRLLLAARRAHAAGRWPLKPGALHAFGGPSPEILRAAFAEVELVGEAAPQAVFGVLVRKMDDYQLRRNRGLRGQDTRWTERGGRLALCLDPHPMCGDAAAPNPARWVEARAEVIEMAREVAEALRRADGDFAAAGFEPVFLKDDFGWQWSLGERRIVIQAATEHPTLTLEEGPDAGDESAPITEGGGADLVGMVLERPGNLVVDLRNLLRGPLGEEAQAVQNWMTRKRPFKLTEMGQMEFTGPPGMDYRAIGAAREKGQLPPDSVRWRVWEGLYFSHAGEAAGWERWWGRRLPDLMPAVLEEIYGDELTFAAIVHAGWRNTKMWSP